MNYRIWRGCILIGALTVLALGSGCSRNKSNNKASTEAAAAPKIELSEKLHDFGNATEGDKVTHVFQMKNTGTSSLVIDRVTTSCGCVSATNKVKEIPPGGTGDLEVTFDTTSRRGANRKKVTVLSNDPSNPRAELEVAINVESLLAFEPFFVRLTPEFGEEQVREAWLIGKLVDQAKLTLGEQKEDKEVSIERAEKTEGGKKLQGLRFKLKGKKVGYGSGQIVVKTGLEKPDEIILRYSWNVKGNLRVMPAQLYFDDKRITGRARTLKVSSSKPDFQLKDITVQSGPFTAELVKNDAGAAGTYEIKVAIREGASLPEPAAAGEVGKLVLQSNDALEPKKEVLLRVPTPRVPRPGEERPGMPGGSPEPAAHGFRRKMGMPSAPPPSPAP